MQHRAQRAPPRSPHARRSQRLHRRFNVRNNWCLLFVGPHLLAAPASTRPPQVVETHRFFLLLTRRFVLRWCSHVCCLIHVRVFCLSYLCSPFEISRATFIVMISHYLSSYQTAFDTADLSSNVSSSAAIPPHIYVLTGENARWQAAYRVLHAASLWIDMAAKLLVPTPLLHHRAQTFTPPSSRSSTAWLRPQPQPLLACALTATPLFPSSDPLPSQSSQSTPQASPPQPVLLIGSASHPKRHLQPPSRPNLKPPRLQFCSN